MDTLNTKKKKERRSSSTDHLALRTQASIISDAIRRDIIAGILAPGTRLILRELCASYNVGVIPLREALSRLSMSGFVEVADQRGFRVVNTSEEELIDIARVRIAIESDALRDAIEHGDLEWEGRVLSAFHQLSRIPMTNSNMQGVLNPEWENAHDVFHRELLSACTSAWLRKLATMLREHSARYRHLSVMYSELGIRDVLAEHRAITDAVLARNSGLTVNLLAEHFATTAKLASGHSRCQPGA